MRYFVILLYIVLTVACQQSTVRLEGYEVHGIDVSRHQNDINWDTVVAQEVDFVFVKASEGVKLVDQCFHHNWASIKKLGMKRGAYHFFHPTLSSFDQAMNFIHSVPLEYGDLPPVLDFEVTNGASEALVVNRLKSWLELVERHYNIRPIIYTNQKLYFQYIAGNFDNYPIWMARYSQLEPFFFFSNKEWDFWQYGNRGTIKGITGDVDLNVFKGSRLELERMCLSPKAVFSGR